jgi:hypothetical protein
MINDDDLKWLDQCDAFVKGELTHSAMVNATKACLEANPKGHIDPFELLIDADICDTKCQPLPAPVDN